jgi:hypothetical protein
MRLILALIASMALPACTSIYVLPEPTESAQDVNLTPGSDDRQGEQDYLAARQTVITLFGLLQQQRYPEAEELLSRETQSFIRYGGGKSVSEVLADGKLTLANGEVVDIEPVTMLLGEDISRLTESVPGIEEQETPARKEVFAILSGDRVQRIVIIKETGRWVLHRTRIAEPTSTATPSAD